MTDGRRHSVDIPISRTLVALRRVRSLRDPSTNSLSKFSNLLENVNWETNSSNGISLRFEKGCKEGVSQTNGLLSESLGLNRLRNDQGDDLEMHGGLPDSKLMTSQTFDPEENADNPCRRNHVRGLDNSSSNEKEVYGDELLNERYCGDHRDKELDLACIVHPSNYMEDVGSCKGPNVGSLLKKKTDHSMSKWKSPYKNQTRFTDDVGSLVSTPCPSISDALSNRSMSLYTDEEVDVVDSSYRGCGLSYCWSRTPRFRESNPSDVEDHPLLAGEVSDTTLHGHGQHNINNEIATCSETPRSLSQKFRPKSFEELVGQNVVVRSLLSAISRGMVTSFYLFHGPRGTGKTSAARIFAAALNCLSIEEHKPCGLCRECILFFSGRSRDVKEVDSVRINQTDRVRSIMKNAFVPPLSSHFKIFIIDECQLLHGETWMTVLNSLDNISQHVVFVMITPDLDKLPRSAVSRSQKYYFPKIKDPDIVSRLREICVAEDLKFDQVALDFIATKSNGSLRDAEMMLDQLSLLGKKITISLAYELIGIVSDDELLDLLDLALSSDTSNTVIRARELMRSKIDPMQLISQLANLIMDVLAGKCQECSSEARKNFFRRHNSEVDKQKLSHALKILSETEKQLRMSKHQTTWLTVALLQLSSVESSSLDLSDSKLSQRNAHEKDGDSSSKLSPCESLKHLAVRCSCDDNKSNKFGTQEEFKGKLELIWKKATELCQSKSLKSFLRKQGKMLSLHVNQGVAVIELQFHHPDYVSRAEKSWKLIASSLQTILGCNVEIRLLCAPMSNFGKTRKSSFNLFSCSRRIQQRSLSTTDCGNDSEYSDYISEKPVMKDRHVLNCYSDCGSNMSNNSCHRTDVVGALRNSQGNVLSTGTASSQRINQHDTSKAPGYGIDSLGEERSTCEYSDLSIQEPEIQPSCFPTSLRLKKKLYTSDTTQTGHASNRQENKLGLFIPNKNSFDTYIGVNDPCVFYGSSTNHSDSFGEEDGLKEYSNVLCWRTPIPPRKAWQPAHQQKRSNIVQCILPCASAK